MENYIVVGTFTPETITDKQGNTATRFKSVKPSKGLSPNQKAIDITSTLSNHQPINVFSTYSEYRGMI